MTMFMQLFTPIFVTKLPDTVLKTLCRHFLDNSKYKPLLLLATKESMTKLSGQESKSSY